MEVSRSEAVLGIRVVIGYAPVKHPAMRISIAGSSRAQVFFVSGIK